MSPEAAVTDAGNPTLVGEAAAPIRVLCVDDEPNILAALKRTLRPEGWQVLCAASGAEALAIMDREGADLVLSDMRMPAMDGAQLLETVHARWPGTVRVLLTGHADMGAAVAAINRGRIYRYLNKPWDDGELRASLRQGLALQGLERETVRLQELTRSQNAELQALNAGLELRVNERTAELSQAHDRLKRNYLTSIKIFSGLIELRDPSLAGHGRRVADQARKLALAMGCNGHDAQVIFVAGMLHDVGLIGLTDAMLAKPVGRYTPEETARFNQHAAIGEQSLMGLDDMAPVAAIIRAHHERFDGGGLPDRLAGAAIPLGARILAIADTHDDMLQGVLANAKMTDGEARTLMRLGRGSQFDPEILDVFLQQDTPAAVPDALPGVPMSSAEVETDMVLARDLVSSTGVLMLSAGHVLTATLIDRIRAFERREGGTITFYIRPRTA